MEEAAAAARKKMGQFEQKDEEESIDELQQALTDITLNTETYTQVDFKMEGLDDARLAELFNALIENITVEAGILCFTFSCCFNFCLFFGLILW